MKIDPDARNIMGGDGFKFEIKIAELELKLRKEEESLDLLQFEASQEVDRHARECLSLRENVARLEEDCTTLRERGLKDQGRIKGLLEEIERKEMLVKGRFVELKAENRKLECVKNRAQDEAHEWRKKCAEREGQLSRLAHETIVEFERKERELLEKFVGLAKQNRDLELEVNEWKSKYGELERRVGEAKEKLVLLEVENLGLKCEIHAWKKKDGEVEPRALRIADDNFRLLEKEKAVENAKVKELSIESNRCLNLSRTEKGSKRMDRIGANSEINIDEELPDKTACTQNSSANVLLIPGPRGKRVRNNAGDDFDNQEHLTRLGRLRKKKAFVSLQHTEVGKFCAKETSVAVEAESSTKKVCKNEQCNKGCGLKTKFKRSDISCSSTARNPDSNTARNGVAAKGVQAYRKRNSKNQMSERTYTGRVLSEAQQLRVVRRAETLQSNLKSFNASFIRPMARSHVSSGFWLGLPTIFCKENLPAHEMKMTIEDEKGLEYEVNYIGRRAALSGGWRGFALDHNLELGDVLVFELRDPTRFKVYIIKAILEEPCEDSNYRIAAEHIDKTENQNVELSKKPSKTGIQIKLEEKETTPNICDESVLF